MIATIFINKSLKLNALVDSSPNTFMLRNKLPISLTKYLQLAFFILNQLEVALIHMVLEGFKFLLVLLQRRDEVTH